MFKYKTVLMILLAAAVLSSGCSNSDKTVAPSNLGLTGGVMPLAIAQHSYTHTASASGGQRNYEFELDHDLLPPGIVAEWVDNDLVFHGNATAAGTFSIPVTVIDANKDRADAIFVINVAASNDVSGTWSMVITVTTATGSCAGEEGAYPAVPVTIVQTGAAVTVSGFLGNAAISLSGTVGGENGNVVSVAGSFAEEGGTTTASHTWTMTSSTTMSGTENWSWDDGIDSCPGSASTVVCTKVAL